MRSECTRQVLPTVSSSSCASVGDPRRGRPPSPAASPRSRGRQHGRRRTPADRRRRSKVPIAQLGVDEGSGLAASACRRGRPRAHRDVRPSAVCLRVVERRQEEVAARPGQVGRDQQPGPVEGRRPRAVPPGRRAPAPARAPGAARPRRSRARRRRADPDGRSGPPTRSPPTSARNVSPDQPPASGVRSERSTRPRCHSPTRYPPTAGHVASRRGATTCPQRVRVERRAVDEAESRRANGPDWDRYADEYQATHGELPRRHRLRLGPRGAHRGRGRGPRRGRPARTCSRSAPGPASARAGCALHGGRSVGLDLSARQLQHSRRLDEETGLAVPSVLGTATALPFADGSFDVVFCSFGALQFVADIDVAVARDGAGPAARRPLRLLGHAPDPVELPRRPVRGRAHRDVVVLGPHAVRRGGRRQRPRRLRRAPPHARRLGLAAGRARLPDRAAARAGVARGPRPGLGWLVAHARPAHPGDSGLRRRPGLSPASDSGGRCGRGLAGVSVDSRRTRRRRRAQQEDTERQTDQPDHEPDDRQRLRDQRELLAARLRVVDVGLDGLGRVLGREVERRGAAVLERADVVDLLVDDLPGDRVDRCRSRRGCRCPGCRCRGRSGRR